MSAARYYYANEENQMVGPFARDDLARMMSAGVINLKSFVRPDGGLTFGFPNLRTPTSFFGDRSSASNPGSGHGPWGKVKKHATNFRNHGFHQELLVTILFTPSGAPAIPCENS